MLRTALQLQLFRSSDLWTKANHDTPPLLAETTEERGAEIDTNSEVDVFFVLQVGIQHVFHGGLESNSHVCRLLTPPAEFFHAAGHMDDTEDAVALMLDNQSLVVSLQDRVQLGPDHVELPHKRHHRIVVFGFLHVPRKPIQVGKDREG
jgi:hypothetical protein